jgi:hypothetical protein
LLVALVVAATLTRSSWLPLYQKVVDRVVGTKIVHAVDASASQQARGHVAENAIDGQPSTFWAPPARHSVGQSITATFASPFRLVYLRVFNGASTDESTFLTESSPQDIEVVLHRKNEGPVTRTFTLDTNPGSQDLGIAEDDVISVQLIIKSVATPSHAGKLAAIGELEFLARK